MNLVFDPRTLCEAENESRFWLPGTRRGKNELRFGFPGTQWSKIEIHFGFPETQWSEKWIAIWLSGHSGSQKWISISLSGHSESQKWISISLPGHSESPKWISILLHWVSVKAKMIFDKHAQTPSEGWSEAIFSCIYFRWWETRVALPIHRDWVIRRSRYGLASVVLREAPQVPLRPISRHGWSPKKISI